MIETDRLVLRPLTQDDAPALQPILAQPEVAAELPSVPHPLPPDGAAEWIEESSHDLTLAIVRRADDVVVGVISLHFEPDFRRAVLGGFVSKEFWHEGYGAEATRFLVRHARAELDVDLVYWLRSSKTYELGLDEGRNGWPTIKRIQLSDEVERRPLLTRLLRR